MLLARGKEEITNKAVCQMLQERKKKSNLPAILKKSYQSRRSISANFPQGSKFTEQVSWLLAKHFGNPQKERAS